MARKVFYSFHFKRDAWRAAQVRNSDALANDDEFGVIDGVEWEKLERKGKAAIKGWINDQLKHTSVTVVLIGSETADRDWVDYEIRQSWARGNAVLGVRIHAMKNEHRETDTPGPNPFADVSLADGTRLSKITKVYDWVADNGRANLGDWVEEAYQFRKKYAGETELVLETQDVAPSLSTPSSPAIITDPAKPWRR